MNSRPPFQYRATLRDREIRLLSLTTDDRSEQPQFRLTYHSLDDGIKYTALSYCWGTVKVRHCIECDFQSMLVSESAFAALRSLHSRGYIGSERQYLWIDAICINQADNAETSHQVRMMKKIYEEAENVVAWLGEKSIEDIQAIELLRKIFTLQNPSSSRQSDIEQIKSTYFLDQGALVTLDLPSNQDVAWEHVVNFLGNPWFSRVWIIQEYLSSTNFIFHCGDIDIEPQVIFQPVFALTFQRCFVAESAFLSRHTPTTIRIRNLWALKMKTFSDGRHSLIDYLSASVSFEATDPRDKIFALANLSSDFNQISTNYALRLEEVLVNTAKDILTSNIGRTNFLCFSQMMERDVKVPSWVPVWSSRKPLLVPTHLTKFENGEIEAPLSLSSRSMTYLEIDPTNALIVTAHIIDRVSVLADIPPFGSYTTTDLEVSYKRDRISSEEFMGQLQQHYLKVGDHFCKCKSFIDGLRSYPTGCAISEVFGCSLIHDNSHKLVATSSLYIATLEELYQYAESCDWANERRRVLKLPQDIVDKFCPLFTPVAISAALFQLLGQVLFPELMLLGTFSNTARIYIQNCLLTSTVIIIIAVIHYRQSMRLFNRILKLLDQPSLRKFEAEMVYRNIGRRLCSTQNGYVIWAPNWTRNGDEICWVEWNSSPLLIREACVKEKSSLGSYELVGDAYIHGIIGPGNIEKLSCEDKRIRIV